MDQAKPRQFAVRLEKENAWFNLLADFDRMAVEHVRTWSRLVLSMARSDPGTRHSGCWIGPTVVH